MRDWWNNNIMMNAHYDHMLSGRPLWWETCTAIVWDMRIRLVANTICRWKGHDLVDDDSYATPDSGVENLLCRRCGQSWHHIYY